jgi:H+/Cl- antiporter ClcA
MENRLMNKTLTALLAAATVAASLAGSATTASAQRGGAFAAGLIGGLAAGAIVGSAIANSRPAYVVAPGPGYAVYPGYAAVLPGPGCYWTRMPVYDVYGNVIGWRGRPVAVCP